MENNKNTEDKNLKNINSSSENVQDKIKEFQQQMDEIQNAVDESVKDEPGSEDSVKAEALEEAANTGDNDAENKETKKPGFFRRLIASVIDQYICFGIGVIVLYLFNLLLKFAGYRVADFTTMMIIVYAIVNILYFSIMNSTKLKNTLGRKLLRC